MKEPEFWEDIIKDVPVCRAFRENWKEIRDEALQYVELSSEFMIDYPPIRVDDIENPGQTTPVYSGNSWKVATAGIKTDKKMTALGGPFIEEYVKKKTGLRLDDVVSSVSSLLPTIREIAEPLENDGHICNGVFSSISPGTKILPHRGDENLMRVHLGLVCDPQCRITVGSQSRVWKEGEIIAFKDGGKYAHSVSHEGNRERLIFIFDLTLDYLRSVVDHPML